MSRYSMDQIVRLSDACLKARDRATKKNQKFDVSQYIANNIPADIHEDMQQRFTNDVRAMYETELALRETPKHATRPAAATSWESLLVRRQTVGFVTRSMFGYERDESVPEPSSSRSPKRKRKALASRRKVKPGTKR